MKRFRVRRQGAVVRVSMLLLAAGTGCTGSPGGNSAPSPGRDAEINPRRLEQLLFDFADDSLMGRVAGTVGHLRATDYLARRAAEMGLEPAGEGGTYFQNVPLRVKEWDVTLEEHGRSIVLGTDFAPVAVEGLGAGDRGDFTGRSVIYAGALGRENRLGPEVVGGSVLVFSAAESPQGRVFGLPPGALDAYATAEALLIAENDYASSEVMDFLLQVQTVLAGDAELMDGPLLVFVSEAFVERLFGTAIAALEPGTTAPALTGDVALRERATDTLSRNVIAKITGRDTQLKDEYVVISAHSDHVGSMSPAVDHDSLRAYLAVVRPQGAESPEREPDTVELDAIRHPLQADPRTVRLDSIRNGADDDGSGSVALLEIGRVLAAGSGPPRRSILFVWHTAEEVGLFGAKYFTDHPTVPLDALVADINVDMIGRGGVDDLEEGGPGYLQLIGSRRLSTQLGDFVEAVNEEEGHGFDFDYQYDADGHPSNLYCRSDHYMYALDGIPIVFMSTGSHPDYHMRTDEPQYIDYGKLARVSSFAKRVVERVANLGQRVVVDQPKPDPQAACRQ